MEEIIFIFHFFIFTQLGAQVLASIKGDYFFSFKIQPTYLQEILYLLFPPPPHPTPLFFYETFCKRVSFEKQFCESFLWSDPVRLFSLGYLGLVGVLSLILYSLMYS